ncbi:MAG: hypothetical protein KBC32_01145 [Candidatus Didemnitutus sp.]|nr:hypothetical protein [Candidatus Didemnitutus sp.]
MELGAIIAELLLMLVDAAMATGDVYAWWKGKENRQQRRAARRRGEIPPPRDRWNRRVITLTLGVVVLTAALVWRWVK